MRAIFPIFLLISACRTAPVPSPDYAECVRLYAEVTNAPGPDGVLDPRVATALAACERVPADSLDSDAAQALAKRIKADRDDAAKLRKGLADALVVTAGEAPPSFGGTPDFVPAPEDAGTPDAAFEFRILDVGADASAFLKITEGCVHVARKFDEKGGTRSGELFELDDAKADCVTKFPEISGRFVAVLGGKIFNVLPREQATVTTTRTAVVVTDGGYVLPDGGHIDLGDGTFVADAGSASK